LNTKRETDFGFSFGFSSVENAKFAFPAPVSKPVSKIQFGFYLILIAKTWTTSSRLAKVSITATFPKYLIWKSLCTSFLKCIGEDWSSIPPF